MKVFLDLDGVCNRLIMHALEFVGCPVSRYRDSDYPLPGNYDMIAAANALLNLNLTHWQFWSRIPRSLWADTPPSQEFPWLLDATTELVGEDNVCFLTSPTFDPDSLAGKLEWIHRFAPPFLHRQYLVGPAKEFCASPEALLIDDCDANVNAFRNAGAKAILVPRPWNSLYSLNTLEFLKAEFAKLQPTELQNQYRSLKLIPQG